MVTNTPISERALRVYNYIKTYQRKLGYAPSIQEIKQHTDLLSLRGVTIQLDKLEIAGYIRRNKASRRAIQIIEHSSVPMEKTIRIPLVGQVQAGSPNISEENIEEYRDLPISWVRGREDAYLLRIKGTSMNKAGYLPEDIAIVIPTQIVSNDDVVVAYKNDENTATIKRYKVIYDHPLLLPQSDDPQYKPLPAEEFTIQGKVIGKLNN